MCLLYVLCKSSQFQQILKVEFWIFSHEIYLCLANAKLVDIRGGHGVTLKSQIEEHAHLDFSDFLSTLFAIFDVINEKFHPALLLIYLVKKQAG